MKTSSLAFMIACVGFSIFIEELMRLTSESRDIWLPPLLQGERLSLLSGSYPVALIATKGLSIAVSIFTLLGLWALLRLTRFGRNWQACSQNLALARLCGVNAERVILQTFVVGTAMAAVSGWNLSIIYGVTNFSSGMMLGFKAMFAAVAGGFGNVRGALFGALFLSAAEVLWSASFGTTYRDVGVFVIIILILLLRPEGFSGLAATRESET